MKEMGVCRENERLDRQIQVTKLELLHITPPLMNWAVEFHSLPPISVDFNQQNFPWVDTEF